MSALFHIFALILRDQRVALLRGALLGFLVLVMGAALLGLSGWFITAAAAAGLAGTGAVFDVFRPSALVRFLALGRAAARYGERVLTHDATLRALETLRLRLLAGHLAAPHARMIRVRSAEALNRLTADIDALDGVSLRLVLPVVSGIAAQVLGFAALAWLVSPLIAAWVAGGYLLGSVAIFWRVSRRAVPLSRRAEVAHQAFRTRLIDMIRARRNLAVHGQLIAQRDAVSQAEARRYALRRALDRNERRAGAALSALASLVAAGALGLGVALVQNGQLGAAYAALGFFTALALAETVAPLRRAVADLGRMADAARRVRCDLSPAPAPVATGTPGAALALNAVTLHRHQTAQPIVSGLSLKVAPGQTVAIAGHSGVGKSTLLQAIAGLHPIAAGQISLGGVVVSDCAEPALRAALTLVPQRSALMAGTVAEALRLAAPDADEPALWQALAAVRLDPVIRARGGLGTPLGPHGEGLSGGEGRRLALARALLRQPAVLLLDEPTEGLDDATAKAVLRGIRNALPQAVIVIAAHKAIETDFADRIVTLT